MHLVILHITSQINGASCLVNDLSRRELNARWHHEVFVNVIEDQMCAIPGGHFVVDCVLGLIVELDDATRLVEILR